MPKSTEQLVAEMIERLPGMTHQQLVTVRANAVTQGEPAVALVRAVDGRLTAFEATGGMAQHRLEFARSMLSLMRSYPAGQWVASRDLFLRAKKDFSANPYVAHIEENSARAIILTKALEDVRPEFPGLEWRKDGSAQGSPVFYRQR